MTPQRQRIVDVLSKVAQSLGGEIGHINWGESEDRMRGFNDGYDDANRGVVARFLWPATDDPHELAYRRGYEEGHQEYLDQEADDWEMQ